MVTQGVMLSAWPDRRKQLLLQWVGLQSSKAL